MDEYTKTELQLSEEHLQQITGGTPEDARNWLRNLPEEHRRIFAAYRRNKLTDESELAIANQLNSQYASLHRLREKTLSDGATASRVGQLRPKKS